MQRYRAKPVEVEAVQWDGTAVGATPIIDWVLDSGGNATYACTGDPETGAFNCLGKESNHVIAIKTIDGNTANVQAGWWVLRGTQGEFYPCRDDAFGAKYEEAAP